MLHDITTKRLACLIFLTVVHDGFHHMYEVLTICFCNMLSLWQASNIILLVLLAKSKKYIRKQYFTLSSLWRIDSPYYSLRAIQERVHCRVFFLILLFSEHSQYNTHRFIHCLFTFISGLATSFAFSMTSRASL